MSEFIASCGQSTASTSVSVFNIRIFRTDFLHDGLVASPRSPRDSQESSPVPQLEGMNSSALSLFYCSGLTSVHDYWENHSFDYIWTFVDKVMSLIFNMLSRFVIAFLPRSKRFLISWLQSPSAVILAPPKYKVSHCFHCLPIYLP